MCEPWRILYNVGAHVKDKHSLKLEQTDFSFSSGQDLCGGNVLLLFCSATLLLALKFQSLTDCTQQLACTVLYGLFSCIDSVPEEMYYITHKGVVFPVVHTKVTPFFF